MFPEPLTIGICALLALVLRRRPLELLVLVQVLVLLVPISVQEYYFPGIHPAAVLIVLYYVIAPRPSANEQLRGVTPGRGLHVAALVLALFSSDLPGELTSLTKIAVTVLLAPLAYVLIAWRTIASRPEGVKRLRWALFGLLGFNVAFAALQQAFSSPVVFEDINTAYYNWGVVTSGRRAGLMGTPLDLGLLCAVCTPLVAAVRSPTARYVLVATCTAGAVLAQSRTALIVVVLVAFYVVLSDTRRLVGNVIAGAVILAGGAYLANELGLFESIGSRFSGGYGDAYRLSAYGWFVDNYQSFLIFGNGPFSDPRSTGAITSSLENTYLVYAYNFGVLFALALFAIHLSYAHRAGQSREHRSALVVACLVFILMICSYSGVAASPQLALILAMVAGQALLGHRFVTTSGTTIRTVTGRRDSSAGYRRVSKPKDG
ncbi:hypothetical protein IEZ26_02360 [Nocardioides cavernae]|uniref:O-antigen ligase domain-containing protein n=1 Tax=Nocardioides cavernae TaxID=1921566 RepID=A0ABR8N898_9ACTN|nr:hypothetical protein [Nocardioides cavernae]MBD3923451.1 hypothetical protein [Nocardioides cavernae]MBM7511624.1 hypothetical protein [Nocardioides cavernae]